MSSQHWFPSELKNITSITLGSTLLAFGVAFFLLPAQIATGGTPGMAMLVYFFTNISTGKAMLLINIPLLAIGSKFIDLAFAIRSIYAILTIAVLVDFLPTQIDFPSINNILLSTIYGGTCIGAGVGFVLKGHASAGGTTIIAKIVAHYSHIKPAQVILVLDILIIAAVGVIFSDMEKVLWSMLSIYVTTQVIDKILTGAVSEKIVHIVSENAADIGLAINQQLGRDGSLLSGKNLNGEENKKLLFVVVDARRIPALKKLVLANDPKALMIVMEASELMGSNRQ